MDIRPIPAFSDNYIWTLIDENTDFFDCIDPGDAAPILHFAQQEQRTLRSILLTHHHHDHIGGVQELMHAFPKCYVYGPEDSRIPYITHPIGAAETIDIAPYRFQILFNPGHTSSHISYYEPQKQWLFCGDTLFSAGCGRVFDGTLAELYKSMQLFKSLPTTTQIFCAHEYTINNLKFALTVEPKNAFIKNYLEKLSLSTTCTLPNTLENELLINPFLRTHVPEVQAYARTHGARSMDELEVFRIIRLQKDNFK